MLQIMWSGWRGKQTLKYQLNSLESRVDQLYKRINALYDYLELKTEEGMVAKKKGKNG